MPVPAINVDNLAETTGRSWEQWLAFLDSIGARELPHKAIAEAVFATGDASGWWAQSITVAYEQYIGRRVPGQDCYGDFSVSASRTVPGTLDSVLARWREFMATRRDIDGFAITRGPDVSVTEKWRHWRCRISDGTSITASIAQKTEDKAVLTVTHDKLESTDHVEHWRAYWKALLKAL